MDDDTRLHWEDAVSQAVISLRRRELVTNDGRVKGESEELVKVIEQGLQQLNQEGVHYRWRLGRLETDLPAGRWHPVLSRRLHIDPGVRGLLQAADEVGRERGAAKLTMDDIIAAWPLFFKDPDRWPTSGKHLPFSQPLAHAHIVGSAEEAATDTLGELLPIHLYLACTRLSNDPAYAELRREWEEELVRSGRLGREKGGRLES